jgi:hypothetical protein
MSNEIQEAEVVALAPYKVGVQELVQQAAMIQECMTALMKKDVHYGVIPGCEKPSLWQPGADKICMLFRLRAEYEVTKLVEEDRWISVTMKCRLVHIPTGMCWGEGVGSANTREKRYANQVTSKKCPKCGKGAIIKGKEDYGGGWLCYEKKGGCKAKYKDGDKAIEGQTGEPQSDAVWDLHNTITKMSAKRAKVAAVLTATGASDSFSQDLEDLVDYMPPEPSRQKPATFSRAPGPNPNADKAKKKWDKPAPDVIDAETGEVHGAKVTPEQIKLIHVLKGKLGIPDADWKARMVKKFGVDSSAKLTVEQASVLIDALETQRKKADTALREVGEALTELGANPADEDRGDEPSAEEYEEMRAAMERDS